MFGRAPDTCRLCNAEEEYESESTGPILAGGNRFTGHPQYSADPSTIQFDSLPSSQDVTAPLTRSISQLERLGANNTAADPLPPASHHSTEVPNHPSATSPALRSPNDGPSLPHEGNIRISSNTAAEGGKGPVFGPTPEERVSALTSSNPSPFRMWRAKPSMLSAILRNQHGGRGHHVQSHLEAGAPWESERTSCKGFTPTHSARLASSIHQQLHPSSCQQFKYAASTPNLNGDRVVRSLARKFGARCIGAEFCSQGGIANGFTLSNQYICY